MLVHCNPFTPNAPKYTKEIVKAFNIVGNPHMVHPDFPGGSPTIFICRNDEQAKKMVTESILSPFGQETIDIVALDVE